MVHTITKSRKRRLQVEHGAYDGRYRQKMVTDKKKKWSKTICRKKVKL